MNILSVKILIYCIHLDFWSSTIYEKEKLERLSVPITIDSAWLISKTMKSQSSNTTKTSLRRYIRDVYVKTSQIFAWHNMLYRVVHLEYLERDPIELSSDIHKDYYKMMTFMETYSGISGQVDNTIFFRNVHSESSTVGLGRLGGVGIKQTICIIEAGDRIQWNVIRAAPIVAHEIGHNLRISHSESLEPDCTCPMGQRNCLMYFMTQADNDIYPFDKCSIENITSLTVGKSFQAPLDKPSQITGCGNAILEENEQCDCGFDRRICEARNEDKCCDGKTCTLFDNATCSIGSCCSGCQVVQMGHVCHQPEDECSYAQVCDGISPQCDIIKKPDGLSCKNSFGRCYNGKCVTSDDSCKSFGESGLTLSYSLSCIKYHFTITPYTDMCTKRVYCTNAENSSTNINSGNKDLCITSKEFVPLPINGTPCGPNMMCHQGKCKSVNDVNNCTATRCSSSQVCNRDGKCVPYDTYRINKLVTQ